MPASLAQSVTPFALSALKYGLFALLLLFIWRAAVALFPRDPLIPTLATGLGALLTDASRAAGARCCTGGRAGTDLRGAGAACTWLS